VRLTATLWRATRFFGVGSAATLAYWVVLLFLVNKSQLDPTLSSVIAYLCGFSVSFTGHRLFTYKSKAKLRGELGRFLATYAICFCAGNFVFWIASAVLNLNPIVAGALLTGCNIALSYVAAELWIFGVPPALTRPDSSPPPSHPD
jgi:putative flippase GtrA